MKKRNLFCLLSVLMIVGMLSVSVFAAPQMVADANVSADEVYEDEVQVDENEPVYEEIEESEESEDYEETEDYEEADEAIDTEEVVEEEVEDPNEVLVLFSEDGDVIYLAKKIAFSATKEYLAYGTSKTLTATITPEETTDKTITWASSNESVATVDQNGVVTAGEIKGTAKITAATVNGKKATCTVYVGAPADVVEFSAMKSTSLAVGKTLTLKAKASCEDTSIKPVSTAVTFEIVEGHEYATIDAKGKIKGVATGEVVVRATAVAGTETAYDEVTINVCIPATKVTLDITKTAMALGYGDVKLTATMQPLDNTDTLTWTSSKEEVATVDENGVVTAHGKGSVKITAKSGSGKSASCSITVGVAAEVVEITSTTTSLAVGKTLTLKAKASCEDGSKPVSTAVTYEIVEGQEYATIDAKGKIKGIATGEVVVRATAVAGTETAYDEVTINVCIPATKVTLDITKTAMALGYGDVKLTATMQPLDNTDTITWTSSKEEIATVDENGLVTAHGTGSVKITAKSGSGKSATCSITVGKAAEVVEITSTTTSLAVGKTLTLKAKASCEDGSKPVSTAVTYEIVEGQEYATIDDKGKLKGIATGKVVVRATAVAGTETAYDEVTINVCIPITSVKFSQSKVTLVLGETAELQQPVLSPENHSDTIDFYSDDESVVRIDESGNLIPVSVGSAKIYAQSGSGKKAYYTVNVVYPEDKLVLAVSKESVKVSADRVTTEIMVLNNPGIAGATLELEFDDSVLEIDSIEGGDFSQFTVVPGVDVKSPYKFLVYNVSNVTGDGAIVKVTFNILDDAQKGTYAVTVKSNSEEDDLMIVDENGQALEHLAVDGTITLR